MDLFSVNYVLIFFSINFANCSRPLRALIEICMNEDDIINLSSLAYSLFGQRPCDAAVLSAAGGDRRYYRLFFADRKPVIGVVADSKPDARAFVSLSEIFGNQGVAVPEVYGHSDDFAYYLEQDLGDRSLFSVLKTDCADALIEDVMHELVRMQTVPEKVWSDAVEYAPFSRRLVMWDLNYFKYEFAKPADVTFDESLLEDDFEKLAEMLTSIDRKEWGFMMRDCQSRNVMLSSGPYFIDYQGGRLGPCLYDAVSFLWQAKAGFDETTRRRMLEVYADDFYKARGVRPDVLLSKVDLMALFRTLQVLGAYGFRGLVQKRAHFIESIPGALKNLSALLERNALDDYPEIKKIATQLVSDARFRPTAGDGLKVKVFSFSYKRGYPEDLSGNGGGFMFDCRGMHNPGRYDEYKPLTGRDKPVIDFLKVRGEADRFADRAFEIIAPSVERYLSRGFSSLQIGFGCTGGRHRSVYCAERVARAIASRYPEAHVELIHREQNIKEKL